MRVLLHFNWHQPSYGWNLYGLGIPVSDVPRLPIRELRAAQFILDFLKRAELPFSLNLTGPTLDHLARFERAHRLTRQKRYEFAHSLRQSLLSLYDEGQLDLALITDYHCLSARLTQDKPYLERGHLTPPALVKVEMADNRTTLAKLWGDRVSPDTFRPAEYSFSSDYIPVVRELGVLNVLLDEKHVRGNSAGLLGHTLEARLGNRRIKVKLRDSALSWSFEHRHDLRGWFKLLRRKYSEGHTVLLDWDIEVAGGHYDRERFPSIADTQKRLREYMRGFVSICGEAQVGFAHLTDVFGEPAYRQIEIRPNTWHGNFDKWIGGKRRKRIQQRSVDVWKVGWRKLGPNMLKPPLKLLVAELFESGTRWYPYGDIYRWWKQTCGVLETLTKRLGDNWAAYPPRRSSHSK